MTAFDNFFDRHLKLTLMFYNSASPSYGSDKSTPIRTIVLEHFQPEDKNVRISFDIEYYPDSSQKSGTAYIKIYNLNDDLNNIICSNDDDLVVLARLEVGHNKKLSTIFEGQLVTRHANFEDNSVVTNMWGFITDLESLPQFSESITFGPMEGIKYSWSQMLSNVATNKGLIIDDSGLGKKTRKVYENPLWTTFTFTSLINFLECMSKSLNIHYFLDGNLKLSLTSLDSQEIDFSKCKRLSKENGLFSDPNVTEAGLEIRCLLNPDLRPFDPIMIIADYAKLNIGSSASYNNTLRKLNSEFKKGYKNFYSGSYILFMSHSGDTYTDMWETRIRTSISDKELS